jgi:predicted transcriptional regulator YheO
LKSQKQGKPSTVEEILFSTLEQLANAIAKTFPRNCEAVVHDLSDPQRSVRFIAGDVTRREVGAPITDLVIRALHREGSDIADRFSYKTMSKDGRELKSSTIFFRNLKGQVIGAFCINFDMTDYLNATHALEVFTSASGDFKDNEKVETFASSFTETVEALFQQSVSKIGKHSSSMSRDEKIRLVQELALNGVFQIKGAVDEVALLMGISKYTVYSYLKKLRAINNISKI